MASVEIRSNLHTHKVTDLIRVNRFFSIPSVRAIRVRSRSIAPLSLSSILTPAERSHPKFLRVGTRFSLGIRYNEFSFVRFAYSHCYHCANCATLALFSAVRIDNKHIIFTILSDGFAFIAQSDRYTAPHPRQYHFCPFSCADTLSQYQPTIATYRIVWCPYFSIVKEPTAVLNSLL